MLSSRIRKITRGAVSLGLVLGLLLASVGVASASGRSGSVVTNGALMADITEVATEIVPGGSLVKVRTSKSGKADYLAILKKNGKRVRMFLDDDLAVLRVKYAGDGQSASKVAKRAVFAAASEAVAGLLPGATVTKVEREDDYGAVYEVRAIKANGQRVEVYLDAMFNVIRVKSPDNGGSSDDGSNGGSGSDDGSNGTGDSDHGSDDDDTDHDGNNDSDDGDDDGGNDRVTDPAIVAAASQAALAVVPGGRVVKVERENDYGAAYEVKVIDANGNEVEVLLDANYNVVRIKND